MLIVTQNINRLNHLLALFKLSSTELLQILNDGRKKEISDKDVFSSEVKISILKKIDKIFNKGLAYYIDPSNPEPNKEESIFFRKDYFNASLNLSAKQIVNKYEEEKITFDTLIALSDIINERLLPVYKTSDNPKSVALAIRKILYPKTQISNDKSFLKSLISNFAAQNILVFEFVEAYNKKEKANINGFYLTPDVIVLKWQKYCKREIFTLIHELGHYLLNEEEIDENINSDLIVQNLNEVEKWCNEFAFNFLIGDYSDLLDNLVLGNATNDYHRRTVKKISEASHLSRLSIYTKLFFAEKITNTVYHSISSEIKALIKQIELNDKAKLERDKQQADLEGRKLTMATPKPIISPHFLHTLQISLYNGIVTEYDFCQMLNIKSDKIEKYLV